MDLALKQLNIVDVEAAELLPSLAQARGFFSQMPNPTSFHSRPIPEMPNPTFRCKSKKNTKQAICVVKSNLLHIRVQGNQAFSSKLRTQLRM
jgi:hypothetical protein